MSWQMLALQYQNTKVETNVSRLSSTPVSLLLAWGDEVYCHPHTALQPLAHSRSTSHFYIAPSLYSFSKLKGTSWNAHKLAPLLYLKPINCAPLNGWFDSNEEELLQNFNYKSNHNFDNKNYKLKNNQIKCVINNRTLKMRQCL